MIALDTSALMAILLDEPAAHEVIETIASAGAICMSAATFSESLIVAERRGIGREMSQLIEGLAVEILPVSKSSARAVVDAYAKWGKGIHPAGLNFGDCFSYVAAREANCPLLFVGEDFSKTDVECAVS